MATERAGRFLGEAAVFDYPAVVDRQPYIRAVKATMPTARQDGLNACRQCTSQTVSGTVGGKGAEIAPKHDCLRGTAGLVKSSQGGSVYVLSGERKLAPADRDVTRQNPGGCGQFELRFNHG